MENKLFLVDGHALIFKMYYAFLRHPMINSKGADMSILFGFTKYILELIEKEKPSHLAVAFDPPGGTFRHEMFPDYKGTREETPQLVIDSLEPLIGICKALRIPVLMEKGFEADDVIGSMAKRAEKEGFDVYMVTPDKDYGQLISDHIFQFRPGKASGENELLDKAKICQKYGINSPEEVIEILTICGDTADNVPGVKGVGEVGAGKLVGKYGTVENIYRHLDELPPKQREGFISSKGHIELSHKLVTIKTDIPLQTTSEQMKVDFAYGPEIADLFEEYEFGSLKKYISHVQASTPAESKKIEIESVDCQEIARLAKEQGKCTIIVEGESGDIFSSVRKVTIAVPSGDKDAARVAEGDAVQLREILEDKNVDKYGYDLKYQYNILRHNGISLEGRLHDIELMHYLINPEKSHKIDILAKTYLDYTMGTMAESKPQEVSLSLFEQQPLEEEQTSRQEEAAVTALLGDRIMAELKEQNLEDLSF